MHANVLGSVAFGILLSVLQQSLSAQVVEGPGGGVTQTSLCVGCYVFEAGSETCDSPDEVFCTGHCDPLGYQCLEGPGFQVDINEEVSGITWPKVRLAEENEAGYLAEDCEALICYSSADCYCQFINGQETCVTKLITTKAHKRLYINLDINSFCIGN